MKYHFDKAMLLAALMALIGPSQAGPYILAGTDADDHGSESYARDANVDGWLFMQKALENLATSPALTTTNRTVVALGSDDGTQAARAARAAFAHSALATSGWSFIAIGDLTSSSLATALSGAGIVMLDSGDNVTGGLSWNEQAALTADADRLNAFVGAGGGLFSQANDYGWLSALVPLLAVTHLEDQGISLTAAGASAFPALTDADLSAGPYHGVFTNVGNIPVLATAAAGSFTVIIGSAGGSITLPAAPVSAVPEPSTWAMLLAGLTGIAAVNTRRKNVDSLAAPSLPPQMPVSPPEHISVWPLT